MRINGFEQIKGFYSWSFSHQDKGVKPQHISLYLFLVNQNNRNNWVEWFKVPYDLAMAGSCISSKKTYYSCLDDLVKWKLIKYQPGVNNWKAPLIKLEVLKDTSTVPQSEPQVLQADVPQHIQALVQAATPQPIHNIKLLTYNLKPITSNLQQVCEFLNLEIPEEFLDDTDIVILDDIEKTKLCLKILSDFGFNEIRDQDKLRHASAFINYQVFNKKIDWFSGQYIDYWKYKNASGEKAHNFKSFLGLPENQFQNAGWDSANWTEKLNQFNNGKSKSSNSEDRKQSVSNLAKSADDYIQSRLSQNSTASH